jgi:hypothetical protein
LTCVISPAESWERSVKFASGAFDAAPLPVEPPELLELQAAAPLRATTPVRARPMVRDLMFIVNPFKSFRVTENHLV